MAVWPSRRPIPVFLAEGSISLATKVSLGRVGMCVPSPSPWGRDWVAGSAASQRPKNTFLSARDCEEESRDFARISTTASAISRWAAGSRGGLRSQFR